MSDPLPPRASTVTPAGDAERASIAPGADGAPTRPADAPPAAKGAPHEAIARQATQRETTTRGATTREAILEAARSQIGADPAGLSIQAIAAEAGVSRQTVHHYFGGLKGLRAALAAEGLDTGTAGDEPTRDRLVDAAVRLFSRPGAGLISIEAIAAEAGLTKGAIYHHFADRAELLRAVARRVSPVEEMRAQIEPSIELGAREGLIVIARAYYSAMRSRSDLVRNLAANSSQDPELARVVMSEIIGQGAPLMIAWFGRQIQKGNLRPSDPALLIQALFGPVFLLIVLGPVFDELARIGIRPAIDNVEAYVDLLLCGIAQPGTEPGGI
ncbi:MAG: TetR/AcrR family transcriptional regulator [Candidatus Limnocylindrales bacterium]|jgi:AcrR family transcriptional regulator